MLEENPSIMHKKSYLTPALRNVQYSLEGHFLASALVGGVTPGQDPEVGGSWNFGEED